jgi:hypothetical protein
MAFVRVKQIPVDFNDDMFPPMASFFADPLRDGVDIPVFITFPSLKVPN